MFYKKLNDMSFRNRMFLYFVVFALIPVIVVGATAYRVASDYVTRTTITMSNQMVEKVANEIDTVFEDMSMLPYLVGRDSFIQESIRKKYNKPPDYYSDEFSGDAWLFTINKYRENLSGIYVIGENGITYCSQYYTFKNDITNNEKYRSVLYGDKQIWFPPSEGSHFVVTAGEKLITLAAPLKDIATGLNRGAVICEVREDKIKEFTNIGLGKKGFILLVDDKNNAISWNSESNLKEWETILADEKIQLKQGQNFIGSSEDLLIKKQLMNEIWSVVGVIPQSEFLNNKIIILASVLVSMILTLIAAFLAAYKLADREVEPLKKLISLMAVVQEGDFSVRMKTKREDEIGHLADSFNQMVVTIDQLIKKESEDQQKLRAVELKALQAHINPHFLYNTLDSIMWLSREQDNERIRQLVLSLTQFFKLGLSKGRDVITLKEEIAHASSYLAIQHIRYQDQFTYEINLPQELSKYCIIKLTLQPLVENAIYHGIKLKEGKGHLAIDVEEQDENIMIKVTDDGVGMSEERLSALINTVKKGSGAKIESYGLVNVDERIKIMFGDEYGLSFDSKPGEGTKVTVTIPKLLEEQKNVKSDIGR